MQILSFCLHISQTIFTFGCAKIVWRTSSHTFITFGTMKRYIASVSALAIALAAMAVPAKRIQFTADQADGTGPWTCTGAVAPSIASNKGTGISSGGELTSPEINARDASSSPWSTKPRHFRRLLTISASIPSPTV